MAVSATEMVCLRLVRKVDILVRRGMRALGGKALSWSDGTDMMELVKMGVRLKAQNLSLLTILELSQGGSDVVSTILATTG